MKKFVAILSIILVACGGGGNTNTSSVTTQTTQATSRQYNTNLKPIDLKLICKSNNTNNSLASNSAKYTIDNTNKEYKYHNNIWGILTDALYPASLNIPWSECMFADMLDNNTVVSRWTWDMGSDLNWGGIKSYPAVGYGYTFGIPDSSILFPKMIQNVKTLSVSYDIEIDKNVNSVAQLLLLTWISSNSNPSNNKVYGGTTAEFQIILDCWGDNGWCNPEGERVTIGNQDYIYRLVPNGFLPDNPKAITFNSVKPQLGKSNIDMTLFLNFLKARGVLMDQEYIDSVQLGTEIILGKGEVRLNSYSVTTN